MKVYKYTLENHKNEEYIFITPLPFTKQEMETTIREMIAKWEEIKSIRIFGVV